VAIQPRWTTLSASAHARSRLKLDHIDLEISGGLLLPGAPRTALIAYAATASASVLSLALVIWPDNGGTMPSKK
jgi:hypothetical protein